jgi:hypothetical protein
MDQLCPYCRGKQYSSRHTITTEEGLILSHAMCALEKDEAIVMPETKNELVMKIMIFYEIESE